MGGRRQRAKRVSLAVKKAIGAPHIIPIREVGAKWLSRRCRNRSAGWKTPLSQILLVESIFAIAVDLHQFLDGANFTDRNDKTPADLELAPQCFRNFRTPCGDQDSIEGRRIGPSQSPVAMPHLDVGVLQPL